MELDREFRQFSEQLRLQTANFSNLSLGDSIWADPYIATSKGFGMNKTIDERRNFDPVATLGGSSEFKPTDWKIGFGGSQKLAFSNSKLDRYNNNNVNVAGGVYKSGNQLNSYNNNGEVKNYFDKAVGKPVNSYHGDKKKNINTSSGKGSGNKKSAIGNSDSSGSSGNSNGAVDKRFKTLPPEEALPRNETIGGYIFVCNNETMEENLRRQLFGLPQRYRDSVRAITPGLPLFLYNYSTHQLHGIFEAASFGGTNIDPSAWEDKKKPGQSRFPAQVRVITRKNCEPLEEDYFRPILHHYDGPKFRLELSVPEALDVLDKFAEQNA